MQNALLVIDFINDIVHPNGKIASSATHTSEKNAIANANKAMTYARQHGWLVILVKVGFESNYHTHPKNSPMFGKAKQFGALALGQFGTEFHAELDVQTSDYVIEKPRVSPFYGTALEPALRANKIEHLYVCGVSTEWAIQATVRDGHDRDYLITIIEDACAAGSEEEHQQSILMLSRIATVIPVANLGN
ncbi:isochorismatase family cysteine hydrolase [Aeromonas dhakensis]